MTPSPVIEVAFGIGLIIALSWFANINDDTGNVAVAGLLLLWGLWIMNNVSKVQSFKSLIGG